MYRSRRLIILSTLSGLLAQAEKPEDIFPTAIEIVADVMEIEAVLIYSLDARRNELVLSAYRGVPVEFARGVDRMKLGEGFNGRVAQTGEHMMVSDAAKDPRLSREAVRREGLRAQLVVPMKSRGQVEGTICVATRQKREFRAEEVELLTAIGDQIGIAIDRTSLYQGQLWMTELLRQSEAKYRELFQDASDAIIIHDMEGNILEANKACERLLGYSINELVDKKASGFLREDALALALQIREKLLSGGKIEQRYEQHVVRRDGSEAIIEMATRLITRDGKPIGFENIGRDVTEERKMRDNLRFYLKQVLRAQEEERKRISRELHDDASQSLLLLIHGLDAIISDPSDKLPKLVRDKLVRDKLVRDKLTELHRLALEIFDGLRRYAQELRPAILDHMGLAAAVEWMAENITSESGTEVSVEVIGGERDLLPETKLVLFRIAQEALTNVKKHSEASKASVKLEYGADKITMTIVDNGKGFELPKRLGDLASAGMLGLAGMDERARLLGGNLRVQSNLGEGTTVTVELPLDGTKLG
jgi:two-component system sensor histidine kinase DegS